jgi:Ca2+-binding EF-hand superfamily protein
MSRSGVKNTPSISSQKGGTTAPAKSSWRSRISKQDEEELKGVFDLFDDDKGGTIDPSEVEKILNELGLKERNTIVMEMINSLKDTNKPVNFEEFLDIICSKVGDLKSKDGVTRVFQLWDRENHGFADFESFKYIAKELGETMNDDELLEMMHNAHILNNTESHDSFNFDEFYNIVTKKAN